MIARTPCCGAVKRYPATQRKAYYTAPPPSQPERPLNKTPNFKQQKKRREEMQKKRNEEKQRQQAARKAGTLLPPEKP